tara:strand:+ start:3407 stop:3772 length:366 start_codon:yes stop_codon:yes gene_type:complete
MPNISSSNVAYIPRNFQLRQNKHPITKVSHSLSDTLEASLNEDLVNFSFTRPEELKIKKDLIKAVKSYENMYPNSETQENFAEVLDSLTEKFRSVGTDLTSQSCQDTEDSDETLFLLELDS